MGKNALKKLFKFCNYILIYQMTVMPLALAADDTSTSENNDGLGRRETYWDVAKEVLTVGAQGLNQGIGAYLQGKQQQAAGGGMGINSYEALFKDYTPQIVDPSQIPPVFQGCLVLDARPNQLSSKSMCSAQPSGNLVEGYAQALIAKAKDNIHTLQNFLKKGHERFTTQGAGCYDKRIEDFKAMLDKREKELDILRENLKKLLDNFKLAAKKDLEGIKATTAMLDGGDPNSKYMKDAKFENTLLGNDPGNVCGSIISAAEIKSNGMRRTSGNRLGGLRGIEKALFDKMNKPGSSGKEMSASEFLSKSAQISSDIDKLARSYSSHMKDFEGSKLDKDDVVYRGKLISKENPALTNILKEFNADFAKKINKIKSQNNVESAIAANDVGGVLKSELAAISSGKKVDLGSLEQRLVAYENAQKKKCFTDIITKSFGNTENFAKRFKDPNVSKGLGREADNALANSIVSYMGNEHNINDILAKVKKEEQKGINSNKIMVTGKSFQVGGRTINASTPLRPSNLIGILVSNCNNNFKAAPPGSRFSPANAISAIRNLAREREQLRKVAATDIGTRIKREMKNCPNDKSTGIAKLSCSGALNPDSAGFCLRSAQTCASNYKGCYEKAKAQLRSVASQQKSYVDKYNGNVDNFKTNLKKVLEDINKFAVNQAMLIDAQLNMGNVTSIPKLGFKLSKESFMGKKEGFDPALEIQDPEKYMEAALKDVENIQKVLEKQKVAYVGGKGKGGKLGEMKKQYLQNYKESIVEYQKVIQDCQSAAQKAQAEVKQITDQANEDNAKLSDACSRLMAFNENPSSTEHDQLAEDLAKILPTAAVANPMGPGMSAQDQQAIARIRSFNSTCGNSDSKGGAGKVSVHNFCGNSTRVKNAGADAQAACRIIKENSGFSASSTGTCTFAEFTDKIEGPEGTKFCIDKSTGKPVKAISGANCDKNKETKKFVVLEDYEYSAHKKELFRIAGVEPCKIAKDNNKDQYDRAKEYITDLANSYNCVEEQKASGQIKVSICNDPANAGRSVAGKDWASQMATQLGTAFGTLQAIQN